MASYASPEGDAAQNMELSRRRGEAIIAFLTQEMGIADSLITNEYYGNAWNRLREAVESSAMEHKDEVLQIIDNTPEESWRRVNPEDRWLTLVDSRNRQLMQLQGGEPYCYMYEHIYPKLRSSGSITLCEEVEPQPLVENIVEEEPLIEDATPIEVDEPILETSPKTLLAVKSNLLYDLVSVINLELELPIEDRWSIAAEWIFPWWTSCGDDSDANSHRNTLQLLNGNVEAKYWFGDRSMRPIMTGWHIGLYAGGGLYDLEHNAKGYQGKFLISIGLSGGYTHTINRSGRLRMEYSLAVGYLRTDYTYYNEHFGVNNEWHTIKERSGRYSWFGPTRAKVSLVWLLNKKGRARQ